MQRQIKLNFKLKQKFKYMQIQMIKKYSSKSHPESVDNAFSQYSSVKRKDAWAMGLINYTDINQNVVI